MEDRMKIKNATEMLIALKGAKAILEKSGEEIFEELRRREKKAFLAAFRSTDISEHIDGDCDGFYLGFGAADTCGVETHFCSPTQDYNLIDDNLSEFYILDADYEELEMDEAIKAVEAFIKSTEENALPLAILNTSIITNPGNYKLSVISTDAAKELLADYADKIDSAVGHNATAEIMSKVLGAEVPVNRQMFSQQVGQKALVFKLNRRPPEGKILDIEYINKIGYTFQLLERME